MNTHLKFLCHIGTQPDGDTGYYCTMYELGDDDRCTFSGYLYRPPVVIACLHVTAHLRSDMFRNWIMA